MIVATLILSVNAFVSASGLMSGTGEAPFWASAGVHDTAPGGSGAALFAGAEGSTGKTLKLDWGSVLGVRTGAAGRVDFIPSEIHAGLEWLVFRADVGIRHKKQDFTSPLGPLSITSGNIINSGNARSMPGITLSLLPLNLGKRIRITGTFGDYKTLDDRYIRGAQVHNTEGYMQFDLTGNLTFTIGVDHYAVWGGTTPEGVRMSTTISDYLHMVAGQPASYLSQGYDLGDKVNVMGNQLGRELFRLDYRTEEWTLTLQHDVPYEDRSGMKFRNFPDGANILSLSFTDKNRWVSDIVLEMQYTLCQSGDYERRSATSLEIEEKDPRLYLEPNGKYSTIVGGADNYFNNYEYRSGWTYYGKTIGNPLFLTNGEARAADVRIISNQVIAQHVGIGGSLWHKVPYRFLCTAALHCGLKDVCYGSFKEIGRIEPSWQLSTGFECSVPFGKLNLVPALYFDCGRLLKSNLAATIGLRYNL